MTLRPPVDSGIRAVTPVTRTRSWPVPLTIACVLAFFLITFRHGHSWGGDFAQYIAHARNIVAGRPYCDTGYIYNPSYPLAPPAYPPVFPLLLTPAYAVRGVDLAAMQAIVLMSFIAFLVAFDRHCARHLSSPLSRVAVVAGVGFSPWYWDYKEEILSDFPFMLFFVLAILLLDRMLLAERPAAARSPASDPGPAKRRTVGASLIAGAAIYLACGTRTVGIVLLPAAFIFGYLRTGGVRRSLLLATLVWAVLFGAQNVLWHIETAYAGLFLDAVRSPSIVNSDLGVRLRGYYGDMYGYWGPHQIVRRVLSVVTGLLAVLGFIALARSRRSVAEAAVLIYALAIVVTPFKDAARYLFPVIPFYVFYAYRGIQALPVRGTVLRGFVLPGVLTASMAVAYLSAYGERRFSDLSRGVDAPASRELFDFLTSDTPRDAVVIFDKPRPLALFTGRRAAVYHVAPTPRDLWEWFDLIGATHLADRYAGYQPESAWRASTYRELLTSYRDRLDLVFENEAFRVYRRRQAPPDVATGDRRGAPGEDAP